MSLTARHNVAMKTLIAPSLLAVALLTPVQAAKARSDAQVRSSVSILSGERFIWSEITPERISKFTRTGDQRVKLTRVNRPSECTEQSAQRGIAPCDAAKVQLIIDFS